MWSCILSLFSYAWRIRAFMEAQINTSLRSVKGCLTVFICRTHLIAFIHKVVYRRLNYDFIAFMFPHSVRNDKFWSFVLLCSFWPKSYWKKKKKPKAKKHQTNSKIQVKNILVCCAKYCLHYDLYGRHSRHVTENNCLHFLQRCNRGIKWLQPIVEKTHMVDSSWRPELELFRM